MQEVRFWRQLVFVVVAGVSCSFMGLDEFEHRPCFVDSDCDAARRRFPKRNACGDYQCVERVCRWEEGLESCNGRDDDCDGWIDEDVVVSTVQTTGTDAQPQAAAYAVASSPPVTYVAVGGTNPRGWVLTGAEVDAERALEFRSSGAEEDRACPIPTGYARCNFSEVGLGVDGRQIVHAVVNTLGCSAGQLRIGVSQLQNEPFSVWLGKAEDAVSENPSNLALGVNVNEEGCTGASRVSAYEGEPTVGATRPVVATRPGSTAPEGALVAWLAAPHGSAVQKAQSCATTNVAVEALGVFVPEGESGWVNGTDDGRPKQIGRTTSLSPPAAVALGGGVYVVGFASFVSGERGVQLVTVIRTGTRLQVRSEFFIPDDGAGHVALAPAQGQQASAALGVLWTSGCDEEAQVRFTVVHRIASTPSYDEPRSIRASGPKNPQLLHRSSGFSDAIDPDGWFLSWMESMGSAGSALKIARVSARTSGALNEVTLRSGQFGQPFLFAINDFDIGHAFVREFENGQAHIESFSHWCRP